MAHSLSYVLDFLGLETEHEYDSLTKHNFSGKALMAKISPFCFGACTYSNVDVHTKSTSVVGLRSRIVN